MSSIAAAARADESVLTLRPGRATCGACIAVSCATGKPTPFAEVIVDNRRWLRLLAYRVCRDVRSSITVRADWWWVMTDWSEFGLREGILTMSAVEPFTASPEMQPIVDMAMAEIAQSLAAPLRGISDDGAIVQGLFSGTAGRTDTAPMRDAAAAFLESLTPDDARAAQFSLDAEQRRTWTNINAYILRHGVLLASLNTAQRQLALDVVRASLSGRGFEQARDIMRLNGLLADLTSSPAHFGEWLYFISIFGAPSEDEPWGWQLDGHHLNINCFALGGDMILTPTFMGSEPCRVTTGPLAGVEVLSAERSRALDLIRSLTASQREKAILYPSILAGALPPHIEHWLDGRIRSGAFQDNAVLPYQGIKCNELNSAQQSLLMNTLGLYLGWARPDHSAVRVKQVTAHLDETWFSWFGAIGEEPFYYRIHSPVVLVEFDQQRGFVFDNNQPSRHHIHTIIRTPNGGDYGVDLLARHHERSNHHTGASTST